MTTNIFPAPGFTYEARFGELAFHLQFDVDGKTMRLASVGAADFATAESVTYRVLTIRPGVFLVTWTEADKTTVTHVEDFENGVVHTNITKPDHSFLNLTGSWNRVN